MDAQATPHRIPVVTVVTIFRDAERFLGEAIDSVFAQSYTHWELMLVDDGSADRSTAIARGYAERHPDRVRYVEHEHHANRGMSASRNVGMAHARGGLIALLDADDVWFPQRLEQQVAAFAAHPEIALVYGNRLYWWKWDASSAEEDSVSSHGIPADRVIEPPDLFVRMYAEHRTTNPGSDVMFRRATALGVGGFDERFRGMFEDQVFLVKMCLEAPVFVSSHCWLKYRQHADSCVARADRATRQAAWRLFRETTDDYLRRRGADSETLRRAFRAATRPPRAHWLDRVARGSRRAVRAVLAPMQRRREI
jgi:glycosyltransferase involved in cell wall biosynthesis